jgi:hypothetical protein
MLQEANGSIVLLAHLRGLEFPCPQPLKILLPFLKGCGIKKALPIECPKPLFGSRGALPVVALPARSEHVPITVASLRTRGDVLDKVVVPSELA